MEITIPDDLYDPILSPIPAKMAQYLNAINLKVSESDDYYNVLSPRPGYHYLVVGSTALNSILSSIQIASNCSVQSILDFGCGAGRVTRWMRAAFPEATIYGTDLRDDQLSFLSSELGCTVWKSDQNIDHLHSDIHYDVIWVGSVFTHLSKKNTEKLMQKLSNWLNPNGILVASFHGRHLLSRPYSYYLETPSKWEKVVAEYNLTGYGYVDYDSQLGYGVSLASINSMIEIIYKLNLGRIVSISERALDYHQDIISFQKKDINFVRPGWQKKEVL